MKLPPSIEAIVKHRDTTQFSEKTWVYEMAVKVAHEACRLQREQDWQQYSGDCHEALESSPLVVPSTES